LRHKRCEVRFEHIGLDDLHLRLGTELKAQLGGKGAVDLDRDEAAAAGRKDRCDGAVAGTDLDHSAVADGSECVRDGVTRGVVNQEVLSELGCALQMYSFMAGLASTINN
jgi:hypothetical protein